MWNSYVKSYSLLTDWLEDIKKMWLYDRNVGMISRQAYLLGPMKSGMRFGAWPKIER